MAISIITHEKIITRSIVINPQKQAASTFNSFATNNDHANNMVANINFKHTFDSTGKELTADSDYGEYNSNSLTVNAHVIINLMAARCNPIIHLNGDQEGQAYFQNRQSRLCKSH